MGATGPVRDCEIVLTQVRGKGVADTVHVTSNLNFSAGGNPQMAARRLLIFAHALRIGRVASTARETFPTKVGTIYTLVATRHL